VYLEGDAASPFIVTHRIGPEDFGHIKKYAKKMSSTVNDVMLAAYLRRLLIKMGENHITLPCPVDLRKYIRGGRTPGICNLTGNYICEVPATDAFQDILEQVTRQLTAQKESDAGLNAVIMLALAFKALPFNYVKKHFREFYAMPTISYSNIGIIDAERIRFGKRGAADVFMTGAVKYVPYFQLTISTFEGACTLSCNLHGTASDRRWIEDLLNDIAEELSDLSRALQ
jgi:NRPS condensation-like uncharacterized protein